MSLLAYLNPFRRREGNGAVPKESDDFDHQMRELERRLQRLSDNVDVVQRKGGTEEAEPRH